MSLLTLFLVALGLSMDAFAVSVSNGICYQNARLRDAFANAVTFGCFQAVMPLIGYYAGRTVAEAVAAVDHWIALILLSFIGGRMIWQAVKDLRDPENQKCKTSCAPKDLLVQGIATSIDALAVGVSFAMVKTDILSAVALIGIVTFICSFIGVYMGKAFGCVFREKAEIFGGSMLILIGIKIFVEQWMAG